MNDAELLAYINRDRMKGFSLLVDQYSALIYKIAASVIMPVGTAEDVQECVSDSFVAFYNHLDEIDPERGSVKAYLAVLTKRRAINLYHTLKKERAVLTGMENEEEAVYNENGVDADTRMALVRAVRDLGEPDSTIVTRRYIFGETAVQIAMRVGLTPEATQKRLQRSLEKLRLMLGGVMDG
ncbi:MAG: sigma-70 family RNA polymerase sigma factor [Oscillospiraceae bacterium]|nr:sigma-70 family RNA polymerase sigma factor [Oscillospiraceae bacterium]